MFLENPESFESVLPVKGASQASISLVITFRFSEFVLQPIYLMSVPNSGGCPFDLSQ